MLAILVPPALKIGALLLLVGSALGLLLAVGIHISIFCNDRDFIDYEWRYNAVEEAAETAIAGVVAMAIARAMHKILNPTGLNGVGVMSAVYACSLMLGLAAGLVGAVAFHNPKAHAAMCPLVSKFSSQICASA